MIVDIHNHVLFDIDDGASVVETSHSMVATAAEQGTQLLVCTPHYDHEYKQIRQDCEERLAVLQAQAPKGIELALGLEVYLQANLGELYDQQRIWTLNQSRYMLVELPMREYPDYTEKVLTELLQRGIVPIIAHPERNQQLRENPALAQTLAELGCQFQLNLSSLLGRHGERIQTVANMFLERGLYCCVGSDAHNESTRPMLMQAGQQALGQEVFDQLMAMATHIVMDEAINPCGFQAPTVAKKTFWQRLRAK
ncbi:MAG: tyrosine-protein phosphatase [Culicoidibacterales bacterium]